MNLKMFENVVCLLERVAVIYRELLILLLSLSLLFLVLGQEIIDWVLAFSR